MLSRSAVEPAGRTSSTELDCASSTTSTNDEPKIASVKSSLTEPARVVINSRRGTVQRPCRFSDEERLRISTDSGVLICCTGRSIT
jgi:hypothetical protein